MKSSNSHDVVIIGAGGMGCATAYHLAQSGRKVLLLEQFEVGHTQGSSHGQSRVFRHTHSTVENASIIPHVYELWQRLEQESGEKLLHITGGLDISALSDPYIQGCLQVLNELNFPFRLLSKEEMRRAHPQFRLQEDWIGLYQRDAGVLSADRSIRAMLTQAVACGAELRERTKVISVTPKADSVSIKMMSDGGTETIYAEQVILTAGPWATHFMADLVNFDVPLRATHQQIAYFAVEKPEWYTSSPVYIFCAEPRSYGFPIHERAGYIKTSLQFDEAATDIDQKRQVDPQKLAQLSAIVSERMAGINPTPLHAEACLYTETPTRDFVIDRHPEHPQILFGAGFSGRGFKFMVGIGRLLADLANSEPEVYDSPLWLENFRLARFYKE